MLNVKIARFREIVVKCGAPEVVTLWTDPKDDKGFQRALRDERIMSVHQPAVGSKKDFGEIGFVRGPNVSYLHFPKSLRRYEGRRIVGVDYALLEQPKVSKSAGPNTRRVTKKPASSHGRVKSAKMTVSESKVTLARALAEPRAPTVVEAQSRATRTSRPIDPAPPRKEKRRLDPFMVAAISEAKKGLEEGGIPIGAALVRDGKLVAVGRNKRIQENDPVTHAETDCLRNAGRLGSFHRCVLYSTLMPCFFCAGAAVQFGIKRIVVGESRNFRGAAEFLREHGVEVVDLDLLECREMMADFIRKHPKLWHEDIGQ